MSKLILIFIIAPIFAFSGELENFARKNNLLNDNWYNLEKVVSYYELEIANFEKKLQDPNSSISKYINSCKSSFGCSPGDAKALNELKNFHYATNIANSAISQTTTNWKNIIEKCSNETYKSQNPKQCSQNFEQNINYISAQADKISSLNNKIKNDQLLYFSLAKYEEEKDKTKEEILKNKEERRKEINIQKSLNTFKECRELAKDKYKNAENSLIDNTLINVCLNCSKNAYDKEILTTSLQSSSLEDSLLKIQGKTLHDGLLKHSLNRSISAYLDRKLNTLSPNEFSKIKNSKDYLYKWAKSNICEEIEDLCKHNLDPAIGYFENKLEKGEVQRKPINAEEISKKINLQALRLNNACSFAKSEKAPQTIDFSKPNEYRPLRKNAENRIDSFFSDEDIENLLPSPHIKERLGFYDSRALPFAKTKSFEERCFKHGYLFESPNLQGREVNISPSDITLAQKEIDDQIVKNLNDISDRFDKRGDKSIEKSTKKLLERNPLALLDYIKETPSEDMSKYSCSLIMEIYQSDKNIEIFNKIAFSAGSAATITLMFTGFGSPLAIWLEGGLLSLGVAGSAVTVTHAISLQQDKNAVERSHASDLIATDDALKLLGDLKSQVRDWTTLATIETTLTLLPSINYLKRLKTSLIKSSIAPSQTKITELLKLENKTVIKTNSIDEQIEFITTNIQGLSEEQARVLIESAYKRNSTVVFGGSRIRGNFKIDSDLDVGFGNLSNSQAGKIINKTSDLGPIKLETTRIVPGNKTQNIPEIKSPEEFFQREGFRSIVDPNPERYFKPSGSVTLTPNGEIIIIPPGVSP